MLDQMTPRERGAAIAKGEPVDRLPCNPNVANGVARVHGCKISEFNHDAKTLAEAQVSAYRRFNYDSIRIFTDLFPWAEAMGAEVTMPDDNTADLKTPAIDDVSMIDRLEPANPYKDGRLPVQLEAMKYLLDMVGDEIGCSFGVVGSFTNSFFLLGVQKTMGLIYRNPEALHKLCKISLETTKAYVKAGIEQGLTPTISEPMSSCTVVSPKAFRTFSLPYLTELVNYIRSFGKGTVIHVCGQTDKIWEDLAGMDIAGLSIDNVASIADCKRRVGDQTKILGNVDPGSIMYMGSRQDVRLKTLECIRDGYDSPKGYVVMSGCSLPVDTPFANIQEMMDTVREVGYPVQIDKVNAMIEECQAQLDNA